MDGAPQLFDHLLAGQFLLGILLFDRHEKRLCAASDILDGKLPVRLVRSDDIRCILPL
jgi:hypothetical protein